MIHDSIRIRGRNPSSQSPITKSRPLLMAPPLTRMSNFKHHLSLYRHRAESWLILNQQTLYLLLRLSVFLLKVVSLTKPCLPLMPREIIFWPLMILAALELLMGNIIGWRGMGLLTTIHALFIGLFLGVGRGICGVRAPEDFEV